MFDLENLHKIYESCTVDELNCDFLIQIFNEILMDLHKLQHIQKNRGC